MEIETDMRNALVWIDPLVSMHIREAKMTISKT